MKYRSRTDIAAEILKIAKDGTQKTRIMYGAYLSHKQIGEYLSTLIDGDLLEYDKHSRVYTTTQKGLQFCRMYERVGILKLDI
jgi:predicted transcriptional regulator